MPCHRAADRWIVLLLQLVSADASCIRPADLTGYDVSGAVETLGFSSFAVSDAICATGYRGTPVATVCSSDGGEYFLSACASQIAPNMFCAGMGLVACEHQDTGRTECSWSPCDAPRVRVAVLSSPASQPGQPPPAPTPTVMAVTEVTTTITAVGTAATKDELKTQYLATIASVASGSSAQVRSIKVPLLLLSAAAAHIIISLPSSLLRWQ